MRISSNERLHMRHGSAGPLVALLGLRACANGVFAAWLVWTAPSWSDVFRGGAYYALIDGSLGMLTVAALAKHVPNRSPPLLRSLTFADSALRLAAATALLALPGIAELPITIVWLFGILGASAAAVGFAAVIGWVVARISDSRAGRQWTAGTHELFDPLAAGGLIAVASTAFAFVFGPPGAAGALRLAGAAITGALAVVFTISAFGAAARAKGDGSPVPRNHSV